MRVIALCLLVLSLAATSAACQTLWNVTVYNNSLDPIGVRLLTGNESQTWVFDGDQQDTLAQAGSPQDATLELFDPASCDLLAREELPKGPGVVVVLGKHFASDAGWYIDAGNDSAFEANVLPPNFNGCR